MNSCGRSVAEADVGRVLGAKDVAESAWGWTAAGDAFGFDVKKSS